MEIPTVCFVNSNSRVCLWTSCNVFTLPRRRSCLLLRLLMPLPVIASFLKCSCLIAPRSLMPFLHSAYAQHLFLNVHPFWVLGIVLPLPCPWRLCALCCATPARWVILLQAVANFFWDPPFPWVRFFGWPLHLTARCRSLYHVFSSLTVFTAAFSLGTSSCAT
jgi:hypothetical protein